jgi:hypothetical protein
MPLSAGEMRAIRKYIEIWIDRLESEPDSIGQARVVRQLQDYIEEILVKAVKHSRHDGSTWTAIGEALGVSKQATRERFGAGSRWDVDRA